MTEQTHRCFATAQRHKDKCLALNCGTSRRSGKTSGRPFLDADNDSKPAQRDPIRIPQPSRRVQNTCIDIYIYMRAAINLVKAAREPTMFGRISHAGKTMQEKNEARCGLAFRVYLSMCISLRISQFTQAGDEDLEELGRGISRHRQVCARPRRFRSSPA